MVIYVVLLYSYSSKIPIQLKSRYTVCFRQDASSEWKSIPSLSGLSRIDVRGLGAELQRCSAAALTALIALFCPYFPEFMTLVGAACLTMIVFVLPVVFSWKLRGGSMSTAEKLCGWLIIAVGVFGGGIGCVQAVRAIAAKLSAGAVE